MLSQEEVKDIDSDRMFINIRSGKGKKDRVTLLSSKVLEILRDYYVKYKPENYVFENPSGGAYSVRSIEKVFKKASGQTNIRVVQELFSRTNKIINIRF